MPTFMDQKGISYYTLAPGCLCTIVIRMDWDGIEDIFVTALNACADLRDPGPHLLPTLESLYLSLLSFGNDSLTALQLIHPGQALALQDWFRHI